MQTRWSNLGDLADRGLDQDRAAVIDLREPGGPRTYSHGAIDGMAMGVARQLTQAGFARGTRIGILSLNRAEYLAAYFGIMRAGLVAVPVNTKLPRETIDYILDDAEIALCFADAEKRPMVRAGMPVIGFDDSGPEGFAARCAPAAFETLTVGSHEIGQMLYTSGSSGRPKGVPLSHAGQLWALSLRDGPSSDRHLVAQPLFHMNGLMSSKAAFAANASLVLMPGFEPLRYIQALAAWRVTTVTSLPTMFARVIKEEALLAALDFSALRRIQLGSAPMTLALFQRIRATFPNAVVAHGYASTEAGPGAFGRHPDGLPTPPLSVGCPVPDVAVRLVDGPSDDEGVLMLRTPALMSGYNNLPQESARVLRGGWYYTGDVMRRDAQGFYHFAGRADDMFVCSGENIHPGEVEKLLERHPTIQQAAVVPLPDEERSQVPVAFVVLRPGETMTTEAVKRHALEGGPAYQHPRRVKFLADLPWAGTNKVDRRALIDRASRLEEDGGWSP
jgi:acyl-CoA synthetase (AMP-forming)/AMP-acid ligase II